MIELRSGFVGDDQLVLTMEGHADGERTIAGDLVCCAASMLCQTLVQRLHDLQRMGMVHIVKSDLQPGDAKLQAIAYPEYTGVLRNTYDTIMAGMLLIEHQYPQCLQTADLQNE